MGSQKSIVKIANPRGVRGLKSITEETSSGPFYNVSGRILSSVKKYDSVNY